MQQRAEIQVTQEQDEEVAAERGDRPSLSLLQQPATFPLEPNNLPKKKKKKGPDIFLFGTLSPLPYPAPISRDDSGKPAPLTCNIFRGNITSSANP
jgi:hypothetical protein